MAVMQYDNITFHVVRSKLKCFHKFCVGRTSSPTCINMSNLCTYNDAKNKEKYIFHTRWSIQREKLFRQYLFQMFSYFCGSCLNGAWWLMMYEWNECNTALCLYNHSLAFFSECFFCCFVIFNFYVFSSDLLGSNHLRFEDVVIDQNDFYNFVTGILLNSTDIFQHWWGFEKMRCRPAPRKTTGG